MTKTSPKVFLKKEHWETAFEGLICYANTLPRSSPKFKALWQAYRLLRPASTLKRFNIEVENEDTEPRGGGDLMISR